MNFKRQRTLLRVTSLNSIMSTQKSMKRIHTTIGSRNSVSKLINRVNTGNQRMKSALVIGASRGIGRQIALTLAKNNFGVVVASKTVNSTNKLPGSINTVSDEICKLGGVALPVQCDCRSETDIKETVRQGIERFGQLDVAVYNAGAILWKPVLETSLKQFDLLMNVNVRGAFIMVQEILPHFRKQKSGRILLVAPPIYSRFFKGKTPYSVSKVGMTILAEGLANELKDTGISISTLWPATAIRAHVTEVMDVPLHQMREPTIFADAAMKIVTEPTDKFNGKALIDEDCLRAEGVTDFTQYRCDPNQEPPRMMPKKFPDLTVDEEMEPASKL